MSKISERINIGVCVGATLLILWPACRAEGASKVSKLLELARKKFPSITKAEENLFGRPLTKAEEKLFIRAVTGGVADCSDRSGKNNDPNGAKEWDKKRSIRAEFVAWLCTDPQASQMVTYEGISVQGARIDGYLDLQFARISFPLVFEKSALGLINLQHAEIQTLFLTGTHIHTIFGNGLKVKGDVFLRGDFKAEGEVDLLGATIGGDLVCTNGRFINKGETALNANSTNIKGSVFLRNDFKAEGKVSLLGATIGGDLDCSSGQFINKGAKALSAGNAKVDGGVYLNESFKAEGEVNLVGATIVKDLVCTGSQFINPKGYALGADRLKVEGSVFLRGGLRVEGTVSLIGATIGGYFVWMDVNSPEEVTLDLRSATVGTLYDDANSWPDEDKLLLNGLVYKEIADPAPRDAKSRKDWLGRQPDFRSQPYEQLAAVFRKSGQDEDARKILIAKNEDKARLTKLTWSEKCWYRVLGPMIGYGYRPLNALWGVAAFIALGWVLFGIGYWGGLITPQSASAYVATNVSTADGVTEARELSDVYPKFNFLVYSIDTFVPLIDLHQGKYWLPNANRGPELLNIKAGGLLRLYLWIHITMGWAITTLLVVGLTGLIRT